MRNLKIELSKDKKSLVITVPDVTQNMGRSRSKTSMIVASTDGQYRVPGMPDVEVQVNIFRAAEKVIPGTSSDKKTEDEARAQH